MNASNQPDFRLLIVNAEDSVHADLKKYLLPMPNRTTLADDEPGLPLKAAERNLVFEIDSAFDGREGFAKVERALESDSRYALVFVDTKLPNGWDGVETVSHLLEKDPELQIVICTAYSDYNWRNWRRITERLGISNNLVILKNPFDPIEVTQLVHMLTAKWASARQARMQIKEMDRLVEERTAQLRATVAELEKAKELAESSALQDPLTKLPNRQMLQNRLSVALQQAARDKKYLYALLYLDLDRFKVINDSLGHVAGDELLIQVAARLESGLREGGRRRPDSRDVVVRLGGDEFAIFLDGIRDTSDALRVANRISTLLSAPFYLRGTSVISSASIGVTTGESGYTSSDAMLRDADTAMYRAKAIGRGGCMLFDDSMHRHAVERLRMESELRQALENNEFFLCYQPIVSLATGQIEGFEALLRWQSPKHGLMHPKDFVPLSEETGLIIPIGAWVLREACQQMRRWQDRFGRQSGLRVSINLSARQFLQPDLVSTIESALRESGIDGKSLRLEFTESMTMEDPKRTSFVLAQLQQLGVCLSIDNFGTGSSSLNYLHHFSVDTLKIDLYFVGNMGLEERNLNIVRTIVSLAHNLHMKVVAGGVETTEQVNLLMGMNCDSVQGFYFSHPMLPTEVEALLGTSLGFRILARDSEPGTAGADGR
ncbi:MAG TPA: EAL domain-containing protein [Candidatus Saccharimonadales bacterium]|nr:EAL domain-containing protein [Candidatus Saccharimonadales bacterium]